MAIELVNFKDPSVQWCHNGVWTQKGRKTGMRRGYKKICFWASLFTFNVASASVMFTQRLFAIDPFTSTEKRHHSTQWDAMARYDSLCTGRLTIATLT